MERNAFQTMAEVNSLPERFQFIVEYVLIELWGWAHLRTHFGHR